MRFVQHSLPLKGYLLPWPAVKLISCNGCVCYSGMLQGTKGGLGEKWVWFSKTSTQIEELRWPKIKSKQPSYFCNAESAIWCQSSPSPLSHSLCQEVKSHCNSTTLCCLTSQQTWFTLSMSTSVATSLVKSLNPLRSVSVYRHMWGL